MSTLSSWASACSSSCSASSSAATCSGTVQGNSQGFAWRPLCFKNLFKNMPCHSLRIKKSTLEPIWVFISSTCDVWRIPAIVSRWSVPFTLQFHSTCLIGFGQIEWFSAFPRMLLFGPQQTRLDLMQPAVGCAGKSTEQEFPDVTFEIFAVCLNLTRPNQIVWRLVEKPFQSQDSNRQSNNPPDLSGLDTFSSVIPLFLIPDVMRVRRLTPMSFVKRVAFETRCTGCAPGCL